MLGRDYILSQCPVSAGCPCRLHMNTGECWREYMVQPVRPRRSRRYLSPVQRKPAANAWGIVCRRRLRGEKKCRTLTTLLIANRSPNSCLDSRRNHRTRSTDTVAECGAVAVRLSLDCGDARRSLGDRSNGRQRHSNQRRDHSSRCGCRYRMRNDGRSDDSECPRSARESEED